jgi:hypothetical protein
MWGMFVKYCGLHGNEPLLPPGVILIEAGTWPVIRATVRRYMPELAAAVGDAARKDTYVMMHQDAFAADYHYDEYILCGLALAYAHRHGVTLGVLGKNGSTLTPRAG